MNTNTISAECAHDMHHDCRFEDCACLCHTESLVDEPDDPSQDEYDGVLFVYRHEDYATERQAIEAAHSMGPYSPSRFACTICGDLNCTWHA